MNCFLPSNDESKQDEEFDNVHRIARYNRADKPFDIIVYTNKKKLIFSNMF